MTSQTIEARCSYQAADVVLNGDQPHLLVHRRRDGRLVVDYTCFRQRATGDLTLEEARQTIEEQLSSVETPPQAVHGLLEADSTRPWPFGMEMPDDDARAEVHVPIAEEDEEIEESTKAAERKPAEGGPGEREGEEAPCTRRASHDGRLPAVDHLLPSLSLTMRSRPQLGRMSVPVMGL
jgi:hypothetical protein